MRFYVDKSAEYLEKGIEQQKAGDYKNARLNLLKAAEYMFKAAEKTEPALKDKRIEQANMLIKKAEELGRRVKGERGGYGREKEDTGADASDWMVSERPNLRLSDVAGLEDVKEQIKIKMIYPFAHPEQAERYGIKKGGGLLLYGPPGTGKTMIAKAIAGEIEAAFFTVKPSEIMSKWVGEAEQNISKLFDAARECERAIIFIDEVESLVPKRSSSGSTVMARVVPQILAEMEGLGTDSKKSVLLFIGATNEPWSLDEAMCRPGRFDEMILVTVPDYEARKKILSLHLDNKPLDENVSLGALAQVLEGYSGADIRRVCEKACDVPFIEFVTSGNERNIGMGDFQQVIQKMKPSITLKMIEKFQSFRAE